MGLKAFGRIDEFAKFLLQAAGVACAAANVCGTATALPP